MISRSCSVQFVVFSSNNSLLLKSPWRTRKRNGHANNLPTLIQITNAFVNRLDIRDERIEVLL